MHLFFGSYSSTFRLLLTLIFWMGTMHAHAGEQNLKRSKMVCGKVTLRGKFHFAPQTGDVLELYPNTSRRIMIHLGGLSAESRTQRDGQFIELTARVTRSSDGIFRGWAQSEARLANLDLVGTEPIVATYMKETFLCSL